jgi:hypothetical protein
MSELLDESRELDRRLNAATNPVEMAELIRRRRLVRAGLDFEEAVRQFERANPVRPVRETFRLFGTLR